MEEHIEERKWSQRTDSNRLKLTYRVRHHHQCFIGKIGCGRQNRTSPSPYESDVRHYTSPQ